MFTIIGIMFSGICFGYFIRNKRKIWVHKLITVLIWFLLFLLGIEVGGNSEIISNIDNIGIDALTITIAAVLGSAIGAQILWYLLNQKKNLK